MSPDGRSRPTSSKAKSVAPVTLLFRNVPAALVLSATEKRELSSFASTLSKEIADHNEFVCLVTDDRALQELNYSFLGHDYPTDVLSFPSEAEGLGEIAISIERASEQAKQFGHSCTDELRILMLHGVLHLTGMDHETDGGDMARAERNWRKQFKLPITLIDRVETEPSL